MLCRLVVWFVVEFFCFQAGRLNRLCCFNTHLVAINFMCTCWHPTATSCMHQYSWMICFSEIHLEIAGLLALLQNITCEKPFEWKTVIVRSKIAFICTWRWKLHWNFYEESIRQTSPTAWWEGGRGEGSVNSSVCACCKFSKYIVSSFKKLFITIAILFSFSCYLVGLKQDKSFGKLAPVGGYLLMAGWLAFAF